MLKTTLVTLLACLFVSASCFAEAKEKEKEEASVVGVWLLAQIQFNGEDVENDDLGRRIIVLTDEGKTAAYENAEAYEAGEPDSVGLYELDDEGNITLMEDRDEDGKIDEQEGKAVEVLAWTIEKKNLVLTVATGYGAKESIAFKMVLKPYEPEEKQDKS